MGNTKKTQIVWNGCDAYIESSESVFTQREEFTPFGVVAVDKNDVPVDEDGELDFTGLFVTENGDVWKAE